MIVNNALSLPSVRTRSGSVGSKNFSLISSLPNVSNSSSNQIRKSSSNDWANVIKPRLDTLAIDEEYRAYTESSLKSMTTDAAMQVIDKMEKYLGMQPGSVGDAKQFHLGDTDEYQQWLSSWCNQLEDWLSTRTMDDATREQAQMALDMLRSIQHTSPNGSLSISDIVASGNAYSNIDPGILTSSDEAFDAELLKFLGIQPPASIEDVLASVFSSPEGGANFVMGMYESRYGVGISLDGNNKASFFSGADSTRPGVIPGHLINVDPEVGEALGTVNNVRTGYSYTYDADLGQFTGPYYNRGYPLLIAAQAEAMGWNVEFDHNMVPMISATQLPGNKPIGLTSLFDTYQEEAKLYSPDNGMKNYEFKTNGASYDLMQNALSSFQSSRKDSNDALDQFVLSMDSYFSRIYGAENKWDVFANNPARNYSPETSIFSHLSQSRQFTHDWLINRT